MELPEDGTRVRAKTYASDEYDRSAEEVVGELATRRVEWLNRTQCYVDGTQVDPDTVRAVVDDDQPGAGGSSSSSAGG